MYTNRSPTFNWTTDMHIYNKGIIRAGDREHCLLSGRDRLSLISSGPHFAIQGFGMYGRNFRSPSRPWRLARLTKCPVTIDARSFTTSYVIGQIIPKEMLHYFVGALESSGYCYAI